MSTGVLYNVFLCFILGLTGIIVFWFLRKARRDQKSEYSAGLDYFSLLFGLMWISTGLGVFWAGNGQLGLEEISFKWFLGPMVYLHMLPALYYFSWSLFKKKKWRYLFSVVMTCIVFLTTATLFLYGFNRSEITYWGSTSIPNQITNNLFTFGVFVPALACILTDFTKRLKAWRRTGDPVQRQLFGFSLGFLIYAVAGFFDALAFAQGWLMLLSRIGEMLTPLIFYFFATLTKEE